MKSSGNKLDSNMATNAYGRDFRVIQYDDVLGTGAFRWYDRKIGREPSADAVSNLQDGSRRDRRCLIF